MRKPDICICENKGADQLCNRFLFATRIVPFLFRRPVFSSRGSDVIRANSKGIDKTVQIMIFASVNRN